MGTKDWTAAKLVECLSDNLPLSDEQRAILVTLVVQREQQDKDADRYRWLRDRNDWYAEPRLDETDGTKWELVFYTPQRIEDPTDDDGLDTAVDAAIAADPEFGAA